jgi:hypothetical protein
MSGAGVGGSETRDEEGDMMVHREAVESFRKKGKWGSEGRGVQRLGESSAVVQRRAKVDLRYSEWFGMS